MSAASDFTSEFSPHAWKNFLFDVMPRQGAWTEEQYLAMTDHTNRLIEFTDGRLEPLPMPTDRRQAILAFLYEAFAASSGRAAAKSASPPCACKSDLANFASRTCCLCD